MNVYEMEGFLRGQCVPSDLLVNESNAAYLVRKLSEIASIKAERDALAVENARYSMSAGHADQRMAESRAVRAALGFNPDAENVSPSDLVDAISKTAVELCVIRTAHPQPLGPAMDAAIGAFNAFNAEEMPETGMLNAYFIMRDSIRAKTPATDAALAAIQAQGVEKFADCMLTLANDPTYSTASHRNDLRDAGAKAKDYAAELREAK